MKKIVLLLLLPSILSSFSQSIHSDTIQIREIIIEANKSKIKLQKIPVSASYLSATSIDELKIHDLADLNGFIPNLFIPDYGSRYNAPIFIRGIGSRTDEPSVGLYVDNIPFFDKGSFNFEFSNIKKIEVLRGPQGTLYGRNTMGGLVKIYTQHPVFKNTAGISMNYGNQNYLKPGFHFNQMINDKVAFLIDAAYTKKDGFFTNQFTDKKTDASETFSNQFKLIYKPTNKLKTYLSLSYENDYQAGFPYAVLNVDTQEIDPVNYNHPSSYRRDLLSSGLNITYEANLFDVNFSTSMQRIVDAQNLDQDFTENSLFEVLENRKKHSFVEELNIKSKSNSKIKWITGVFAFQNKSDRTIDVDIIPHNMKLYTAYDQNTFGIATFGQISYPFLQKFEFTLGLRYDYEKAQLDSTSDRIIAGNTTNVSDLDLQLSFQELLPKASLSYHPSKNTTTYLSYSKGYKAGGFNAIIERPEDETYQPEYSINYEFGFKYKTSNKKLTTHASLFYIDWNKQQITQSVPSGLGFMIKNAGESESKGAEIEIQYQPNKAIDIALGYGYTDAVFKKYIKNQDTDYTGNRIPYVPTHTFNSLLNYRIKINNKPIDFVLLNLSYSHFGKLYWNESNNNYQNNYGLLSSTISVKMNKLSFGLWGKNLTDQSYNTFYFDIKQINKSYVQLGNPTQVGVFLKYKLY